MLLTSTATKYSVRFLCRQTETREMQCGTSAVGFLWKKNIEKKKSAEDKKRRVRKKDLQVKITWKKMQYLVVEEGKKMKESDDRVHLCQR